MKRAAALASALVLAGCVTTTQATAPVMPSYVTIHADLASVFPTNPVVAPSGLSVDWGGFQSKYVAAGTTLGISRDFSDKNTGTGNPTGNSTALLIGGGPEFHIPLGAKALLIPALNIAYRLSEQGFGLAAFASLGAAYRIDAKMYAGLEAETPLVLQQPTGEFSMFPGAVDVKALFGFYY